MDQSLILVNLLVKLGVAAAVSSALVRSVEFQISVVSGKTPVKATDLPDLVDQRSHGPGCVDSLYRQELRRWRFVLRNHNSLGRGCRPFFPGWSEAH